MPLRRIGEWSYSSTFLDLGTRWRWVVSFTPMPLYPLRGVGLGAMEKRKIWHCREWNPGCQARCYTDWAIPTEREFILGARNSNILLEGFARSSSWYWRDFTLCISVELHSLKQKCSGGVCRRGFCFWRIVFGIDAREVRSGNWDMGAISAFA
jgi:hypothetical protein